MTYKIGIIEDEIGILSFLEEGLTEEGYEIQSFTTGKEALENINNTSIDLLLLDWMLPDISGLEVCKKLRDNGFSFPILFITAKNTVDDVVEGLQAGAMDYIKKPFSFKELLIRIEVQLRNIKKIITFKDLVIVLDTQQVFKEGIEYTLTHKEYDLLVYLFKNNDKICTRKEILTHVWDIHFEYDTGVIDVYITSIRKKLHLRKNQYIKTVHGVGYRIIE